MGFGKDWVGLLCLVLLHLSIAATFLTQCDARNSRQFKASSLHLQALKHSRSSEHRASKKLKTVKRDTYASSDPYYAGTPFSMPPYQDVLGSPSPSSSPQANSPYCMYPPLTPQLPSTTPPTPINIQTPPPPMFNPPIITPNPPESMPSPPMNSPTPNTPIYVPSPPSYEPSPPGNEPNPPITVPSPPGNEPNPPITVPSPPGNEPNPPITVPSPPSFVPSPPGIIPSPPVYVPSPPVFVPGPIVFLPPIVYPPPSASSPPVTGTTTGLWCVAKPTVPDPIIQEAMNYACGSGADCDSIQPNGSCYQPDTLIAHASFAFNSYWQRTKAAGGTCDFGGTAMLVTRDPSVDGCHFITGELQ